MLKIIISLILYKQINLIQYFSANDLLAFLISPTTNFLRNFFISDLAIKIKPPLQKRGFTNFILIILFGNNFKINFYLLSFPKINFSFEISYFLYIVYNMNTTPINFVSFLFPNCSGVLYGCYASKDFAACSRFSTNF